MVHTQSTKIDLGLKINRFLFIISCSYLPVKFESDRIKTIVCILPTSLVIHNLHVKFESVQTKTVVCIVHTSFIHRVPKLAFTFDPVTQNQ